MDIFNVEGKFVVAEYLPTKKRFRTTFTKDKNPCEGASANSLVSAVRYKSEDSAQRAIRKRRNSK